MKEAHYGDSVQYICFPLAISKSAEEINKSI